MELRLGAGGASGSGGQIGTVGNDLAVGIPTLSRDVPLINTLPAVTSLVRYTYVTAPSNLTVTKIRTISGSTQAAGPPTLSKVGLYTVAANGDVTLVASSANLNSTLWFAQNTTYETPLTTPSSYNVVAGQRYAVALLCVGGTQPTWGGVNQQFSAELAQVPRVCAQVGASDLPASTLQANLVNTPYRVYAVLLP